MNKQASSFYKQEFDNYTGIIDKLSQKIKTYSSIRIAWFLLGLIVLYYTSTTNWYWVVFSILTLLVVFVILAVKHSRLINKKKEATVYLEIYRHELEALEHNFSNFFDGKDFIDNQHPYTSDIDIFGKGSVFQMLNRGFSDAGKAFLANVFASLENDTATLRERQKAVEELSHNPKWLSNFRALGSLAFIKESTFAPDPNKLAQSLPLWIKRQSIFKNTLFKVAQYLFPIASLAVFIIYLLGIIPTPIFIIYLFVSFGFTGYYSKQINKQHVELSKQSDILFRFQALINSIEKQEFKSEGLLKIQQKFYTESEKASQALKNLGRITQAFDSRLNLFGWLILNYFLLWDIRQSIRLEKWKSKHQELPSVIFEAIAEMEMLVGLATFKFNRNDLVYPELLETGFVVEGKGLGHPLMQESSRVDNDVLFPSKAQFSVITGANMAGKSTYLRTVGVNLILALMGAPVCAKSFKTSILQPFTSIKTTDSLSNNESYFYAELLRLQRIIDALKTGKPYFIILDEILKGTNSKDKEQGSKALIRKLVGLNAVGIIATHDLQLAELSKSFPDNVKTACFEVEIENDQLVFDYKLREGVSQNLNATFLMKQMGIS